MSQQSHKKKKKKKVTKSCVGYQSPGVRKFNTLLAKVCGICFTVYLEEDKRHFQDKKIRDCPHPLKTLKYVWFSVFKKYRKETLAWNGKTHKCCNNIF